MSRSASHYVQSVRGIYEIYCKKLYVDSHFSLVIGPADHFIWIAGEKSQGESRREVCVLPVAHVVEFPTIALSDLRKTHTLRERQLVCDCRVFDSFEL